jgi:hypothetical protein
MRMTLGGGFLLPVLDVVQVPVGYVPVPLDVVRVPVGYVPVPLDVVRVPVGYVPVPDGEIVPPLLHDSPPHPTMLREAWDHLNLAQVQMHLETWYYWNLQRMEMEMEMEMKMGVYLEMDQGHNS